MMPDRTKTSRRAGGLTLLALAAAGLVSCDRASTPRPHTKVLDTGPLLIDRIYRSMDGPGDRLRLDTSGMDWITAYRTEVVDAGDGQRMGDEFFCHSQVQLDNTTRLLVTATGINDIRFPEGFGLPLNQIINGIPDPRWRGVSVYGMVLNNFDPTMNRATRVRATLNYFTDAEARAVGLKKLYKVELPMTVQPSPGEAPEVVHGGEACVLVGGLKSHWLVPPGKQTTTKLYRDFFPVDATVHYANVHLHNHGVRMRVIDLTAGTTLWQTDVIYEPSRRQIAQIPVYSSVVGFPVFKDHEYEIQAEYDNVSSEPVDAMAVIYLYYHPLTDVNITYPDPPPPPQAQLEVPAT